jgi:hypothetical protein
MERLLDQATDVSRPVCAAGENRSRDGGGLRSQEALFLILEARDALRCL